MLTKIPNCLLFLFLLGTFSCAQNKKQKKQLPIENSTNTKAYMSALLDTIWRTEQEPIRLRDSYIQKYGVDAIEVKEQQGIYEKNHRINEKRITLILDENGWPSKEIIGSQGNRTICNVIQHADNDIRIKYLPIMKQEVLKKNLDASFLVRAEDRIATERGDLQIYGGQMKYYPKTKSFNVWPIYDPINIDKRRSEIGLIPIAQHLKSRFNFDWNLEEQLKRTKAFKKSKLEQNP